MIRPIFLIEDNPMDLDLTRRAFRRHHLANPLIVARDGAEACALAMSWPAAQPVPAVVLLGLKLPKVDGLEVLRCLRAHPLWHNVPVVVLTASRDDHDVQAAYLAGACSSLVKPLDVHKLVAVVALSGQLCLSGR